LPQIKGFSQINLLDQLKSAGKFILADSGDSGDKESILICEICGKKNPIEIINRIYLFLLFVLFIS